MEVQIREFRKSDVYKLHSNMRVDDKIECLIMSGLRPLEAIKSSVKNSSTVRTACINGKVVCVFGVCPATAITNNGVVWLLSTNDIDMCPLAVLRCMNVEIPKLCAGYSSIYNYVMASNKKMIKALNRMGFTFDSPLKISGWGIEFLRFSWGEKCV